MAPVTRSQRKELLTIIRERKRSIGRSIGNAIQGSRWTHKLEEVGKCEIIFCLVRLYSNHTNGRLTILLYIFLRCKKRWIEKISPDWLVQLKSQIFNHCFYR